jgi:hypothetical protein
MSEGERFAMLPLPEPGMLRDEILRLAVVIGDWNEMLRYIPNIVTREELEAQQRQTAEAASRVADIGVHLMDQVEALMVRQDKQRRLDAKRKADQERRAQEQAACEEQAEILQYLAANPEPGGAPTGDPRAETDETHHPTGDLHALGPVDKERFDPEADDQGALPRELLKGAPANSGNYVEPDLEELGSPKDPKQVPQPVAVSLW